MGHGRMWASLNPVASSSGVKQLMAVTIGSSTCQYVFKTRMEDSTNAGDKKIEGEAGATDTEHHGPEQICSIRGWLTASFVEEITGLSVPLVLEQKDSIRGSEDLDKTSVNDRETSWSSFSEALAFGGVLAATVRGIENNPATLKAIAASRQRMEDNLAASSEDLSQLATDISEIESSIKEHQAVSKQLRSDTRHALSELSQIVSNL